jgi:hypothetical protein
MRFNVNITIDDDEGYEGGISLKDAIIDEAAYKLIKEFADVYSKDNIKGGIEEKATSILESLITPEFKNHIAASVADKLTARFDKTQQYKSLVAGQEVASDATIKSGLKEIVAQIVKSEMKKVFN